MGFLRKFERRIELIVGDSLAVVFGGKVQIQEVTFALRRQARTGTIQLDNGTFLSPSRYTVFISPEDRSGMLEKSNVVLQLTADLEHFINDNQWTTQEPVIVFLQANSALRSGQFRVQASRLFDDPAIHGTPLSPEEYPQESSIELEESLAASLEHLPDNNGIIDESNLAVEDAPSIPSRSTVTQDEVEKELEFKSVNHNLAQEEPYNEPYPAGYLNKNLTSSSERSKEKISLNGSSNNAHTVNHVDTSPASQEATEISASSHTNSRSETHVPDFYDFFKTSSAQSPQQSSPGVSTPASNGTTANSQEDNIFHPVESEVAEYGDYRDIISPPSYDPIFARRSTVPSQESMSAQHAANFVDFGSASRYPTLEPEPAAVKTSHPAHPSTSYPVYSQLINEADPAIIYDLRDGVSVIGRGQDSTIRIHDTGISRKHAEITSHNGILTIRDLGSTNGTMVNQNSVDTQQLHDGDIIHIGHLDFRVRVYTEI